MNAGYDPYQGPPQDPYRIPPYNPADYAAPQPGNMYPSPPQAVAAATGAAVGYRGARSQPSSPDRRSRRHRSYDRSSSDRSRSRSRHRSSKSTNRARSKSRGVKDRIKNMDDRDRKIAASLAGAIGGGFVGHEMGHGTFPTLLGAVLGGAGLRALENKKGKKRA